MSGRTPMVSIGMPVYNGERFLRRALDSLLAQTYRDFELIISDNASTDGTAEISRMYAARDPRARYVRFDAHVDAIGNFDRVLRLATGEYFMWAAADDLWEPAFISTLLTLLHGSPHAVLAFPVFDTVNERGERIQIYHGAMELPSPDPVSRLRNFLLQEERRGKANLLYGLMPRRAIVAAGGFARWAVNPWGADMLVVFRLLCFGDLVLSGDLLFHKRLVSISAHVLGQPERRATRYLKTIPALSAFFAGYAHVIARNERLAWRDKLRLRAAIVERATKLGAAEIGRHLLPWRLQ